MEGEWQYEPVIMVNHIQEHFEKAFSFVQCVGIEEVLDVVDAIITAEVKRKLLRLVIIEKVKKAMLETQA